MLTLLLSLSLQNAEAKKLLDALAPPAKDGPIAQLEWKSGEKSGVGVFERQKAWRLDTKKGDVEMVFLWDGKSFLNYMKKSNRFFRVNKDSPQLLVVEGGPLAEIYFSGNADRLLANSGKVVVSKEKLEDVEVSKVALAWNGFGATSEELVLWIDAERRCRRAARRSTLGGKPVETPYDYTPVTPPTAAKDVFGFKPPADAKDFRGK